MVRPDLRLSASATHGNADGTTSLGIHAIASTDAFMYRLQVSNNGAAAVASFADAAYTVRVRNNGPGRATRVRFTVTSENLPLDFHSVEFSGGTRGFGCRITQEFSFLTPTVECAGGTLDAGESVTIVINAGTGFVVGSGTGRLRASVQPQSIIIGSSTANNSRTFNVNY